MLRKLAILTLSFCATAAPALSQSLFSPVRNDFQAGVTAASALSGAGIRVATGDFNNDGFTDAVVTVEVGEPPASNPSGPEDENVFVFLGDGRGLFTLFKVFALPRGTFAGAVVTGHFNADANLDVAAAVEDVDGTVGAGANGGVIIGFGDGTGDFPTSTTLTGQVAESGLTGIARAKLNGDNIDDIVIVNSTSNSFTVFLSGSGTFAATNVATCSGPVALALGNLDVTPGIDLAVACDPISGADAVRIFGGVNGVFTQKITQPNPVTLSDPRDMVIADLNKDGSNIQDIAVLNSSLSKASPAGSITLLRNDGNAIFSEFTASGVPVGDGPRTIDAGDIDGDGDIDLLVANWITQDISVMQASITGAGNAANPNYTETFFAAGFNTFAAAFADLDGRGNLDVVAVNANDFNGTLSAYLGGGNDLVQRAVRFTSSGNIELPNAVAVADFNGDGFQDFALANAFSDTVSVFRSTAGDTSPAAPFALLTTLTFAALDLPFDILAADLDADGDQDLVVLLSPDTGNGKVAVFRNNGTGTFTQAGANFAVGALPWSMVLADLDNDGIRDLAVTNLLSHTVSLFKGGASASFTAQASFSSTNGGTCGPALSDPQDPDCLPNGIAAGDIDGNGTQDLVVAAFGSIASGGTIQVFSGNGAMGFTHVNELFSVDPVSPPDTINHQFIALRRLDGTTGPPDIVAIGLAPDDFVSVFLNDGTGNTTFTAGPTSPFVFPAIDIPAPDAPRNTLVRDLNSDGFPDIATIGIASNNVGVLLGNGDGTFSSTAARAQAFGTVKEPNALGIGDFNNDGLLDVVVAGARVDDVAILYSGFLRRSDLNGTGRVDGFDLAQLGVLFGIGSSNPAYQFYLDVNMDGTIDGADLTILALAFGSVF